jgi:hypothetical protein
MLETVITMTQKSQRIHAEVGGAFSGQVKSPFLDKKPVRLAGG